MADPALVAALERAVEAEPNNGALRLHVAQLLEESGRPADALAHCRVVLAATPADKSALGLAARTARAVGDEEAAQGYESLLGALGLARPTSVEATDPPDRAVSAEIDAFISNALSDSVDAETPLMTLADVGGLDDVKRQLQRSFIGPMQNPELRKMYGKSLRGGLLMYGPPGCGKTFLARAVAGELGARFYAVGLHDVLDMWIGMSERNVHELFQVARRNAPCVLFLDELDALGQTRTRLAHQGAMRNVVIQLLSELDGMAGDNEGVFVLGATNQPWDLDPALRRPGRLDRTVLVLPPDPTAREAILRYHLRDRPVDAFGLAPIVARTENFSGADLRMVCEDAAEHALDDSLRSGTARPITASDLEHAAVSVKPSTGPWFEVARNFVTFANQAGEYDDLAAYLKKRKLV